MELSVSLPPRDHRFSSVISRFRICQYLFCCQDFRIDRVASMGYTKIVWPQIKITKVNKTALIMIVENYYCHRKLSPTSFGLMEQLVRKSCAVLCDQQICVMCLSWFSLNKWIILIIVIIITQAWPANSLNTCVVDDNDTCLLTLCINQALWQKQILTHGRICASWCKCTQVVINELSRYIGMFDATILCIKRVKLRAA